MLMVSALLVSLLIILFQKAFFVIYIFIVVDSKWWVQKRLKIQAGGFLFLKRFFILFYTFFIKYFIALAILFSLIR